MIILPFLVYLLIGVLIGVTMVYTMDKALGSIERGEPVDDAVQASLDMMEQAMRGRETKRERILLLLSFISTIAFGWLPMMIQAMKDKKEEKKNG